MTDSIHDYNEATKALKPREPERVFVDPGGEACEHCGVFGPHQCERIRRTG